MTWMNTYSGKPLDVFNPKKEHIFLGDIAHALSNICRYSGHCKFFYSVAEHSILVSQLVPPPLRLAALMHDAAEAYLGDVIRPHKKMFDKYRETEDALLKVIYEAFNISYFLTNPEYEKIVKEADNRVLAAEKKVLFPDTSLDWELSMRAPKGLKIEGLEPIKARTEFIRNYYGLKHCQGIKDGH